MKVDLLSRVVTYLWVISMVLLWLRVRDAGTAVTAAPGFFA